MNRGKGGRRTYLWLPGLTLIALLLAGGPAMASTMTLLSEDRSVSISAEVPLPHGLIAGLGTSRSAASPFSNTQLRLDASLPWFSVGGFTPDYTLAMADQQVSVSGQEFVLSSVVEVQAGGDPLGLCLASCAAGTARAESFYEVVFSVPEPTQFVCEYELEPGGVVEMSECVLEFAGVGTRVFDDTPGIPANGWLEPGTYALRMNLVGAAGGDHGGTASSRLRFAVLPEPSTVSLALAGLVLVAARRRTRRF